MTLDLSILFPVLAAATWIAVPIYAAFARGRFYAIFSAVLMTFALPGALVLHARLRAVAPDALVVPIDLLFAYSMAAAGLQFAHLVRARMRSSAFRWLVSVPGQTFIAGGMLSGPWLLALLPFRWLFDALDWPGALLALTFIEAIPLGLAVASVLTSVAAQPERVRITLSREGPKTFGRVPVERVRGRRAAAPSPPVAPPARPAPAAASTAVASAHSAPSPATSHASLPAPAPTPRRPLRIVQLTDTHLGPWQSVARLRRRVARLMAHEPDLIALTGDYLTMESMGTPGCLVRALEPLAPYADRCVAIFGNHDHEAPEHVRDAMAKLGIRLLIDEEACFETPAGAVQVIGSDYLGERHAERLAALLARHPRRADHLRLLLLHDPFGFHALPEDDVDLVLSGHTHGGQVGLVSLGLDWTVLSRTRWPDQGLFARGATRLYVHRGTGFYGFPLRVGVPAEHSLLEIEGF
ncbi:MAG: metallophosphoesterase [Myxococcota bacterium]